MRDWIIQTQTERGGPWYPMYRSDPDDPLGPVLLVALDTRAEAVAVAARVPRRGAKWRMRVRRLSSLILGENQD